MLRTGRAREGALIRGSLNWSRGDEHAASIDYLAAMHEPDNARLTLTYTRGSGQDREQVRQSIMLCYTVPNFGGKRWWMICPYRNHLVGKLYFPPGGDRFASREAWRLGYHCQRVEKRQRPFEKLFRLQRKLGCYEGWEAGLQRPKGMRHKTFERHLERYWDLDEECAVEMMGMLGRLSPRGSKGLLPTSTGRSSGVVEWLRLTKAVVRRSETG